MGRPQQTTSDVSQPPRLWSLGRLNHVAIAVPDLEAATSMYRDVLGATVSEVVVCTCIHVLHSKHHIHVPTAPVLKAGHPGILLIL